MSLDPYDYPKELRDDVRALNVHFARYSELKELARDSEGPEQAGAVIAMMNASAAGMKLQAQILKKFAELTDRLIDQDQTKDAR